MPDFNRVPVSNIGEWNVDCKSIAKSAETSALPAAQHHLNHMVLVGSSSAVAMMLTSHLMDEYNIIQQLILSLGNCRGQLILFDLDYIANILMFYYSNIENFKLFYYIETGLLYLVQEISRNIYKYDIVKQNILQILSLIQDADTTAGYGICLYFGTSTFINYRTAQYHCHIYLLCSLNDCLFLSSSLLFVC